MSDKHHITIHHIKLYRPTKTKQEQLEYLLKNWNKAIRSALKIVKHKADLKGIPYQDINPKDTSQICSVCGEKGFRLSQNRFLCDNLHLQNADYNASVNIAKKAI